MSKKCQISKSRISPWITRNAVTTSTFMFIPVLAEIFPWYRQPRKWHVFFSFFEILRFRENIKNLSNFRTPFPNFCIEIQIFQKFLKFRFFCVFGKKFWKFLRFFCKNFKPIHIKQISSFRPNQDHYRTTLLLRSVHGSFDRLQFRWL